jgi:hypothetical protein
MTATDPDNLIVGAGAGLSPFSEEPRYGFSHAPQDRDGNHPNVQLATRRDLRCRRRLSECRR